MRTTKEILEGAKKAKMTIASATTEEKNRVLEKASELLRKNTELILSENAKDLEKARESVSEVMLDRLTLTRERIEGMAASLLQVASLPDPVGRVLEETDREDGLKIKKVSVPFGVIAVIFESRPNVTSDAAALTLKSGNACVLRGGKEAFLSNKAIADTFREALRETGMPEDTVNLIEDTSRNSANELMAATGLVDLLIPRGGAGLIRACVENAKVPCIETGTGICHIYVDGRADLEKALNIVDNAKTSRPSVCNAAEVCLVDKKVAKDFLPMLYSRLVTERKKQEKIPVELRADTPSLEYIPAKKADDSDFSTEFLDYIMAVKTVDGVSGAVDHIRAHSTGHSEAIVTEDPSAAHFFTANVDSAAVYINASTRFTDGGEFGLGCEIGISTQRMHARGPMGLREMNTYKYIITGDGHIR